MTNQPMAPAGMRKVGKTRNPWGVWLLSLVTFGIYYFYWYYQVNKEVSEYDPSIEVNPGIALCAILFGGFLCGIPTLISIYNTGKRIAQAQGTARSSEQCSPIVGLLLALIGFASVYYQSQTNKVWDMHGNPPEGTPV